MRDNNTADYFQSRAEQEEEAAGTSINALAVSIHFGLASHYRALAYEREIDKALRRL